jgi:RNA polymerase sigma-70 factor (ECF subfamily)
MKFARRDLRTLETKLVDTRDPAFWMQRETVAAVGAFLSTGHVVEQTPETLIARCAAGDRESLRVLYERTSAHLFAVLRRILVREDLAQEALQEVFVSVWRNAGRYSERKGGAFTWMVSIARYRALDIKRNRKHEISDDDLVAAELDKNPGDADVLSAVAHDADVARLRDCMGQLQTVQRNAVSLAFFSGLTHHEVAERLQAPLGSIKSWIRRGLESLKGCLER